MNTYQILSSGSNAKGQLGQNNLEDSSFFRPCYFVTSDGESITTLCPGNPLSICCGSNHTILLLRSTLSSKHEIWGCGDSKYTQLDSQTLSNSDLSRSLVFQRLDDKILSRLQLDPQRHEVHTVVASWNTTFIIIRPNPKDTTIDERNSRDTLVSFGSNELGNLGVDQKSQSLPYTSTPLRIKLWELFISTYGAELSGFRIVHLVAGVHHIILVVRLYVGDLDIDRVLGWGGCRHGQLGQVPQCEDCILYCPTYLSLDVDIEIKSFALGNQHTIFLDNSGHVHGFGSNRKGQLNGLDRISNGIQIGTTWGGSYVVYRPSYETPESWHIFSTEKKEPGHSNDSSSGSGIIHFPFNAATHHFVKLACGSEHVMVCLKKENTSASEVWGWGWNEHGNMGIGSNVNVGSPTLIHHTGEGEDIVNIWAGYSTSWIAIQSQK